jgi:trans-aconitate 2-methyltransferase
MHRWNARQYLEFTHERTRPAHDPTARVETAAPLRVVNLGCGPGDGTAPLFER